MSEERKAIEELVSGMPDGDAYGHPEAPAGGSAPASADVLSAVRKHWLVALCIMVWEFRTGH